jgi:hypothetical protein
LAEYVPPNFLKPIAKSHRCEPHANNECPILNHFYGVEYDDVFYSDDAAYKLNASSPEVVWPKKVSFLSVLNCFTSRCPYVALKVVLKK